MVGETPHSTHYTLLANSNFASTLNKFSLYMIPSCETILKMMYKRDAEYEIILTRNLIAKTKYYYKYLI